MRPVKMLLGLIVGLVFVMFIAKLLLMAILFAIPVGLLFFAIRGFRHHLTEHRFDYQNGGYQQNLDPTWRSRFADTLVPEREKPFDWMRGSRTIEVL